MLGFLALLLINAVLFVASDLIAGALAKFPDATPEDPQPPRSDESSVVPVVWGTVKLAANVTMFEDVEAIAQKEKVKTGIFSSKNVTTGWRYEAVFQTVLCHGPVDELIDIIWQETKNLADSGTKTSIGLVGGLWKLINTDYDFTTPTLPQARGGVGGTSIQVEAPDLFGGPKHGGGVTGNIQFYWGDPAQTADASVSALAQSRLGVVFQPRYEGICHAVLGVYGGTKFNFGEFGSLPPLYFLVRRCPSALGLTAEQTNIGGGANPAEMAYETLTNTVWGLAVPPSQIDVASFIAAGVQLASEGIGLNMSLTSQQTGDTVLTELMRYTDGQIQQNPVSGLIQYTLNRGGYDVATLPVIDEGAASKAVLNRPTWTQLVNEVKVTYTKVQDGVFRQVPTQPIQDIGTQRNLGVVNSQTIDYTAVMDGTLAVKLGTRDMRKLSTPLAQIKGIEVDRRASTYQVGSLFVFSWAKYGIAQHVFRVVSIDYGNYTDEKIQLSAVEDIFALDEPFYATPVPPNITPTTIGDLGPFSVTPETTVDGAVGTLELIITGGGGRLTAIEFQEQTGQDTPSAWHETEFSDKFAATVDLSNKHTSLIAWRVQGILEDGSTGTLADGEVEFPVSNVPDKLVLSAVINPVTGSVDVYADYDEDTAYVRVVGSTTHVPTEAEVRVSGFVAVSPGPGRALIYSGIMSLPPNGIGYISGFAYNAVDAESPFASIPVSWPVSDGAPTIEIAHMIVNPTTGQSVDLGFRIKTKQLIGGTLFVWVNHDGLSDANFANPQDGAYNILATPAVVDETAPFDLTGGGAGTLLRDIRVHASRGKLIYAEFIDNNSVSSGQISFTIRGGGGIIDENGNLIPGAITDAAQFAAGIAPVEVYSAPLPSRPDGTIAYNTTDSKLYKRVAGSWVNLVNAPDLTGLVQGSQIADGAITPPKLVAGTRPVRIVSALPGSGDVVGDIVYLTTDGKIYRWTGSAWTTAVSAVDIAGQLIANQLADGAVTGPKIFAGSVTADKLFIMGSRGAALNLDPNCADATAWTDDYLGGPPAISLRGLSEGVVGSTALSSAVNGPAYIHPNNLVPLDPLKVYRIHAWIYVSAGCNGTFYMGAQAFDKDQVATLQSGGGAFYSHVNLNPTPGQWTEFVGYVGAGQVRTLPADSTSQDPYTYTGGAAKFIRLYILLNYLGTNGYMLAQDFRLEEVSPGTLIRDGVISTDKLSANAVTADKISANAVTAGKINAAAVGTTELQAASVIAEKIGAGAITTEKLFVTGGGQTLGADPELKDPSAWSVANITFENFSAAAPKSGVYGVRSTVVGGLGQVISLKAIPVDPSKVYRFRAWVRRSSSANGVFYYGGTFRNADGTPSNDNGGYVYAAGSGTMPTTEDWQEYVGTLSVADGSIPSTASYFYPILYLNYAGTGGFFDAQDFRVEEALPSTLIKDGAVTTTKMTANSINGDRIAARTLDATKIVATSITSAELSAASVIAGKIAAGAINANSLFVDGVVNARVIALANLREVTPNLGIILSGRLNALSGAYIDLDATGALPVLYHPLFQLNADGTAVFSGTLSAANGVFSGTVASSSFTTGLADFTGSVNFRGTIRIYSNSLYGENPDGSIRFYNGDGSALRGEIAANWSNGSMNIIAYGPNFLYADYYTFVMSTNTAPFEIQRPGGVTSAAFRVTDGVRGSLLVVDVPTVNNDTGLQVIYRDNSGTYSFKRVRGDNIDTGGAGNRNLRILN